MTEPVLQGEHLRVPRSKTQEVGKWLPSVVFLTGFCISLILWMQERGAAIRELHDGLGLDSRLNMIGAIALGGMILSLMLALFTWQMTTSRARALEMARAMNHELIESETRYRQMFEGNSSITYLLDPADGKIIDANEAAAAFWGYSLEELRSLCITDINTASLEMLQNTWKNISSRGNYINEWRHTLKSGEIRDVEVFGGPLTFQDKPLLFFIAHDITERKQAEQALAMKQRQLEELNASLEERVNNTVDELRRKDKILIQQNRQAAMGEMINNIAHQWRQPLNSLGLVIQNTHFEFDAGLLTPEQMDLDMKLGMELIQFMSQTIDDFRTFFREDKEIKRFCIAESISRAVTLLEGSLMTHGIRIIRNQQEDLLIDGYPNEYAQALLNLLINARDALMERQVEQPEISLTVGREEEYAVVTITDNAGGIPIELIERIFDPYFTTKEQNTGTGIGLYMSKMIIEKHMGGSLNVTNLEGGAQFRIRNRLPEGFA
ncbi:PAS domain-containing sensor histidine kinase [Pelotalea chapellei]|uniref:histidine kinase n=1 Tax=Pelotalea chapellei TaxID=44671 RepID=A0ABS5U6B6_9BACT|nr:PAS domain-containing sensor histidine kinase [Pelotalea chapellei]MBT1071215.1 PAS domain-containing sensor histidine kinase [Pelotalea chapellei]